MVPKGQPPGRFQGQETMVSGHHASHLTPAVLSLKAGSLVPICPNRFCTCAEVCSRAGTLSDLQKKIFNYKVRIRSRASE